MLTFTDQYQATLIISKTNQGGLDLQIDGGYFNQNKTTLSIKESQDFLAGLKVGEYYLSRPLPGGGLEFVNVWNYTSLVNNLQKYEISIQSSQSGTLALGSFRCDSLDNMITGITQLLGDS